MRRIALVILASVCFVVVSAQTKPATESQIKLAKAAKTYQETKLAFSKKPKANKLKVAFVHATVAYGTVMMLSPDLGPRDKYPGALKLYREALVLDPKNKEAIANKKAIEDIYKSMGRPIPK